MSSRQYQDLQAGRDDSILLLNALRNVFPFVSRSQIHQDILVCHLFSFKQNGYFVEFGATDGMQLSNTYVLEKHLSWQGILSEPASVWHDSLRKNRNCIIDTRCVWEISGESVNFMTSDEAEYSGAVDQLPKDRHEYKRKTGRTGLVETITLTDLLVANNAPDVIDYLSIDTEGSEFLILRAHDFGKFIFRFISCEHNFTESRNQIFDLLISNGYHRVLVSASRWDDWYIHDSFLDTFQEIFGEE